MYLSEICELRNYYQTKDNGANNCVFEDRNGGVFNASACKRLQLCNRYVLGVDLRIGSAQQAGPEAFFSKKCAHLLTQFLTKIIFNSLLIDHTASTDTATLQVLNEFRTRLVAEGVIRDAKGKDH